MAATCDVFIRHFDNDGLPLELNGSNADLAVNETDYSVVSVPAIAVNDAGEMAITWETNDAIYVSVIRSDGRAVIRDAAVSPSDVDDPVDPAVAAIGSTFYLLWHPNNGNPSVAGLHQRSLAGSNLTAIRQVDPGVGRSAAAVATHGSQILHVWSRDGVLVSQRGSSSGPAVEVVSFPGERIGAPTIKTNATNATGYVVAYGRSKAGQSGGFTLSLLDDMGRLVRNVTLLDKGRASTDSPAVAVDASGNIAAVWSQCAEQPEGSVDGSGCAVMIALYDGSLTPLSEPRVVNTTTMGDQFEPSVTAVANGFAVAWSDASGIGDSDGGIRARVIYADTF